MNRILLILSITLISISCHSHKHTSKATYLGNEGVMITHGKTKVLFDPFFHNGFNTYQLVPEDFLNAMFKNQAPFDNIDAIFVSHAHGDHFAADRMLKFLKKNPKTKFIGPKQAIDKVLILENGLDVKSQLTGIDLKYKDQPKTIKLKNLLVEAVRIPHSGWPKSRLDISNLVFRVTLDKSMTVMHMGDADPNDIHFKPYKNYWESNLTNTAFPPYWFFDSTYGPEILKNRINAETSVGVHVPIKVPYSLIQTGEKYFSKPGEEIQVNHTH